MNLLELASAYRALASGVVAEPYMTRRIVTPAGLGVPEPLRRPSPAAIDRVALDRIQDARGCPSATGTAHTLNRGGFPTAIMGKTGTTNDFRDALFVGSTHGLDGIAVAVRIGLYDNRSLGPRETGGRVALTVFEEIMVRVYGDGLAGPVFRVQMERISRCLDAARSSTIAPAAAST